MKIISKILLFIAIATITINTSAQGNEWFFGISVDPKMLKEGPGYSYEGIDSSLDIEISFGFEREFDDYGNGIRIAAKYQNHDAIKYQKITLVSADYMIHDIVFEGLHGFAGMEIGTIHRSHPDAHYSNPYNYRRRTTAFTYGLNFELQYQPPFLESTSVGLGSNWFRAENELIIHGKEMRFETFVSMYYRF